jgi:hypothetical protein
MKALLILMIIGLIMSVVILIDSTIQNNIEASTLSAILCLGSATGAAICAKILDERK